MEEGAEKRATPRKFFKTHAAATYQGKQFTVLTVDVSMGGMAIVSQYNLVTNSTIALSFNISSIKEVGMLYPVEVSATIVHSMFSAAVDGFKVGLKFSGLNEKSVLALKQYLEQ